MGELVGAGAAKHMHMEHMYMDIIIMLLLTKLRRMAGSPFLETLLTFRMGLF